jgi:hypothetical protein
VVVGSAGVDLLMVRTIGPDLAVAREKVAQAETETHDMNFFLNRENRCIWKVCPGGEANSGSFVVFRLFSRHSSPCLGTTAPGTKFVCVLL